MKRVHPLPPFLFLFTDIIISVDMFQIATYTCFFLKIGGDQRAGAKGDEEGW